MPTRRSTPWLLCLLIVFPVSVRSQIVNIEKDRIRTDTSGWAGSAEVHFSLEKNKEKVYRMGADLHIQYKTSKHLVMLLLDADLVKSPGNELVNNGFAHLRYNYSLHKWVKWEVFQQAQYNKIRNIDLRLLTGTGPRFKLSHKDDYAVYLGSLYMFEHERETGNPVYNNHHRWSTYLSFNLQPFDNLSFVSTTYIQPRFDNFSDYRVSTTVSARLKVVKTVYFRTGFQLSFDAIPPPDIPRLTYKLENAVGVSF